MKERKPPELIPFKLQSSFQPLGDQPSAIKALCKNLAEKVPFQTLRGVTGSGKTFTIANVIQAVNRPTLVIAPNKTLAAQLYGEFREFFPENRVRYFVSYYDYYQPEAYIPSTDTYIEKDAAINEEIDKLRHSATRALLETRDTIIVASVSCIYGLGAPDEYFRLMFFVEEGDVLPREEVLRKLVEIQYKRADFEFYRGSFRVRGETIDIFPSDENEKAIRLVFFGDTVEELREIDPLSGKTLRRLAKCAVYPVSHFVMARESVRQALGSIRAELMPRLKELDESGKSLESQRLEQRTLYDLELLSEIGFCPGIENYSRHLSARAPGTPPPTLLDYFPKDFLLIVDESHVTVSQIGAMYKGDRSRKETLVQYGFRLPSALDNRPLRIDEFWERVSETIFVSATPGDFEIQKSQGALVDQINRPTGLLDPEVFVRPATNQVDELLSEIQKTIALKERVLVLTLTKRMAEDLSEYLRELGIKCRYLHSDINTIERVEILKGLRRGDFDVLIGINLLREGLDLVEVSLVAILDADKEGFLRSARSLIQIMGRAARNLNGRVILYGDTVTGSMQAAIDETQRRRKIQSEFNAKYGIIPQSAKSNLQVCLGNEYDENFITSVVHPLLAGEVPKDKKSQKALMEKLRLEMYEAASKQEFERAAEIRDTLLALEKELLRG